MEGCADCERTEADSKVPWRLNLPALYKLSSSHTYSVQETTTPTGFLCPSSILKNKSNLWFGWTGM